MFNNVFTSLQYLSTPGIQFPSSRRVRPATLHLKHTIHGAAGKVTIPNEACYFVLKVQILCSRKLGLQIPPKCRKACSSCMRSSRTLLKHAPAGPRGMKAINLWQLFIFRKKKNDRFFASLSPSRLIAPTSIALMSPTVTLNWQCV